MDRVGIHSDIYLLGAILFEIVTGKTPHTGPNVTACLLAAAANVIQPPETTSELIDIAMKAMAAEPQDRYATVGDLQDALRLYQAHAQSVMLSNRAAEDLAKARAARTTSTLPAHASVFRRRFCFGTATAGPRPASTKRPWPTPLRRCTTATTTWCETARPGETGPRPAAGTDSGRRARTAMPGCSG